MCGRFWVSLTKEQFLELLALTGEAPETNFPPNWNVAPTHDVLICAERGDGGERRRRLKQMRWGLIPVWAKEAPKFSTFNAKAETLEDKATWKGALNKFRCVVPVSGFYEWRGPKGEKQPFAIQRRDGKPMLLAGLWAYNDKIDPEGVFSFTIITCRANQTMRALHERAPVILDPDDLDLWLGPDPWGDAMHALLKPCPEDLLTAYPVNKDVGSVKNNRPDLMEPQGEKVF